MILEHNNALVFSHNTLRHHGKILSDIYTDDAIGNCVRITQYQYVGHIHTVIMFNGVILAIKEMEV